MFGEDYLQYVYDGEQGTRVSDEITRALVIPEYNKLEFKQNTVLNSYKQQSLKNKESPKVKRRKTNQTSHVKITVDPNRPSSLELEAMVKNARTRSEISALNDHIPSVLTLQSHHRLKVKVSARETNPFEVRHRTTADVIKEAEELLKTTRKTKLDRSIIVDIPMVGMFSDDGLSVLSKFCQIAQLSRKVDEERQWLSKFIGVYNESELSQVKDVLWNKQATYPLVKVAGKCLDVESFADLACERWLDNFVIDICIAKFIKESKEQGTDITIYFPSELFDWLKSADEHYIQDKIRHTVSKISDIKKAQQIIIPMHMTNHWGIIVIDLINERIMFDDGLHAPPPRTALRDVKKVMSLMTNLYPQIHQLPHTHFWKSCRSFQRFGMPSQKESIVGSQSCGVGVVLAARDFIRNGPKAAMTWKYSEMNYHRIELMIKILNWN